jgi:hypothetical protein
MKHFDTMLRPNLIYFQSDQPMVQLIHKISSNLAHAAFLVFVVLVLCTPAWRSGPFTWWPVWQSPVLHGENPQDAAQVGLLSLLPMLCVLAWGGAMLARRPRTIRRWKTVVMLLPLLALSLLILRGLDPALNKRTIVQVIGLGLFWFSYLYVLNCRPSLTFPLLVVVLVQGGVAVAQFGLQRDLGLAFLGEFLLDRQIIGTSVLWSSEAVWLRGYGLTAHPNVLGAMLAVLLLVLLPQLRQRRGWQQAILGMGMAVGLLGLLVSFSRTGWLAFLGGVMYWAFARGNRHLFWTQRTLWLPFVLVPVFLFLYHDLILSRWIHLDTAIEARSIQERLRDAQVAMTLIGAHPWWGVGAGNALAAALAVRPDAGAVHSVSLLVMAELGILGGVCWLLFMILPLLPIDFFDSWRRGAGVWASDHVQPYRPAWVGVLIAGLFDTPLWLTTSWRAALLLGLLAALQVQKNHGRKEDA